MTRTRLPTEEAAACYERAARCLARGADPEVCLDPLIRACQLDPRCAGYRLALAEAWAALGEVHEAANGLEVLDLATVPCADCLCRARDVFQAAGRLDRVAACDRHLSRLNQVPS
jgi:hypothetical protein